MFRVTLPVEPAHKAHRTGTMARILIADDHDALRRGPR